MNAETAQGALDDGEAALVVPATPYRVLARKYRPSNFDDLIGQEPMVRTLSNAFDLNRIHQAYILTGVRGVGKTTTARILARAFNYEVEGKVDAPTIHMPELGRHCQAIIESRHIDVIEMDAASNTGIDDVREIIESARYRPVMARTKVFIIDEVHMLSKAAFNGLLKTLEEPPEHVKFLFATTEIEKVPITVRSRCQRFDLRRIEPLVMVAHLAGICAKEHVTIESDALAMVARAAEGSVRDALSLLDQAIAHGAIEGQVSAKALRDMLGLADRSRIIDLFENVMQGDIATALDGLRRLHDTGADPAQVLTELAEYIHFVTRLKLVPSAAKDASVTPEERTRGSVSAQQLSVAVLTRAWQILVKGLTEIKDAPRPMASADMVLVRLAFVADLPTPEEALRQIGAAGGLAAVATTPVSIAAPTPVGRGAPQASQPRLAASSQLQRQAIASPGPEAAPSPYIRLASFADVVAHAAQTRDIQLKIALENDVRLVRFEQNTIEFELVPGGSAQVAQMLNARLLEWTGQRWMVAVTSAPGAPSLREQARTEQKHQHRGVESNVVVRSVLDCFPGARIVAVRGPATEATEPATEILAGNDEIAYVDHVSDDQPIDDDL